MTISIRILSQQEVDKYIVNSDLNGNITTLDSNVWNYRDVFDDIPPWGGGTDEQIGLFLDYVQDNTGKNTTLKSYKVVYARHSNYPGSDIAIMETNKNSNAAINKGFDKYGASELRQIPSFRPVFTFRDNNYSTNLIY